MVGRCARNARISSRSLTMVTGCRERDIVTTLSTRSQTMMSQSIVVDTMRIRLDESLRGRGREVMGTTMILSDSSPSMRGSLFAPTLSHPAIYWTYRTKPYLLSTYSASLPDPARYQQYDKRLQLTKHPLKGVDTRYKHPCLLKPTFTT